MFVKISDLPSTVQRALDSLGYRCADIPCEARYTYSLACSGSDGRRGFVCAVNLATGEREITKGSWGGANMFNPRNAVDLDTSERPLPEGFAIISGTEGEKVFASIAFNPQNFQRLIVAPPELTEVERKALAACRLVSSYRAQEFQRYRLGTYGIDNPIVRTLADKGLVSIKGRGVSVTTEGKNALGR